MSIDWAKQLVDNVSELDSQLFNLMPVSIVIRIGQNDEGEQYFDASVFTGHADGQGDNLADVINAESLSELFSELVKAL